MSPSIVDRPLVLPFMQATPIAVVELVGLLGMIWYRRTTWWAQPLLLIVVGRTSPYRILFLLKTVQDNHTGYLQYTETLVSMTLVTAGVLTTSEAAPRLWSRLSPDHSGPRARDTSHANWLVAAEYGAGGTGNLWFEPWGSPGFHVKVWYSDGTTDEVDAL